MSKIIKAADLKVLIPNESQTVIPAPAEGGEGLKHANGIILDGSNLLKDAQDKAGKILAAAEEQAQTRFAQVETELETMRLQAKEAGYEAGYQEGLRDGKEQAFEDAADLLTLLQATVEEGVRLRASALQALEDDFLKFSLLLADKIVRKNVGDDVAWLAPIIKDALQSLGAVQQIMIRLNPIDYSMLQEEDDHLHITTRAKLQFESDLSITSGGCLIESENGVIDARLEKRLGKIAQHLTEVLYNEEN